MATQSQVLARKYRPQVFDDLIGQEALVRTITNAIKQNRLAQAYMLTGIRGIGKTTSARIIAKGLNCIGEDGKGGMTPNPCGKCKHCIDIANDSHIDVIEIDAASNTGVDNVREIIEGAKYNPVSARYKIYIIDEVHMLSKAAFNALLKTLEEPPERVKFIFATTEIRKVPLTILSRCQRFDLKRIETDVLEKHLASICEKEKKTFSHESLYLIAKAGNGSVRDALSILDQAITQLPDNPSPQQVREMLGIADSTLIIDLYKAILQGQMDQCFDILKTQHQSGTDALSLVQDMMNLTYTITCLKVVPKTISLNDCTKTEQAQLKEIAQQTSMQTLTAYWQILTKGVQEVRTSNAPFQSLDMLVIRMAYMSDIPTPEQLLDEVKKNTTNPQISIAAQHSQQQNIAPTQDKKVSQAPLFQNLKEIVDLARKKGERMLAFNIENFVKLIGIKDNTITCALTSNTPGTFSTNFTKFLLDATGVHWQLKVEKTGGQATIKEQTEASKRQQIDEIRKDATVAEIEKLFSGAKIEKVKHLVNEDESDDQANDEDA